MDAEGEDVLVVQRASDALPSPEQTGQRYQLSGEIARGGMGAVLRGRDLALGRNLAVKVLLEKHADRPEVARRFIEEAQIGGQLQHPGVVPVYDIGHFGERPFFTMKLVKGQTLAALLGQRADPAADRPRFLGIALQVAQTLAYAHAKGVIHRDLKPANVMVGAFGEVQVMDWGLAKVLAEGDVPEGHLGRERERPDDITTLRSARSSDSAGSGSDTQAGTLLGTPAYMPPEQANGDIAHLDRRSDVFGLGAILCEILTGKPPYVGRSVAELRLQAANGDLADARARLEACGADPELILLTKACLGPEASARPKDAQAVAEALTAYLDGVQERLHQAELAEAEARAKAVEEAKRRRLTLALAGTVLLALTLGGGGWLWVKADHDARQAQVTRDVNEAINQATALREKARRATVGGAQLFAQAREQAQRALALVENGPADAALKDQAAQLQADLDAEEKDRQLVAALEQAQLAQAETPSENRFARERAVPKFRQAFQAYGLLAGVGGSAAAAERIRQRPAAVREAIVAALDDWDEIASDPQYRITEPHLDWLRAVAAAAEPEDDWTRGFRATLAEKDPAKRRTALERLARAADVPKVPPLALRRLSHRLLEVKADAAALALLRRAQRQHPGEFWVNEELGFSLRTVIPRELDEEVRFLTVAVALRPGSPGAHFNLGVALTNKSRLDEAIATFRKALEIDPKYAAAYGSLGIALAAKGQFEEAIAYCRKAIRLDPKNVQAHNSLGDVLQVRGQFDAAIASYKKAIEVKPKSADSHYRLGDVYAWLGQYDKAGAALQKVFELGTPANPEVWFDQAYLRLHARDADGYRQHCRRMVQHFGTSRNGPDIMFLAHVCVLAPDALPDKSRVLSVAAQRLAMTPPVASAQLWSRHVLALACYRAGDYKKAIELLEPISKKEAVNDANVKNWLVLAMAQQQLQHHDEARSWFEPADKWIRRMTRNPAAPSPDFTPPGWHWHDWLGLRMLQEEAAGVLGRSKTRPGPP
jgi:serine/threonine-protein kinase